MPPVISLSFGSSRTWYLLGKARHRGFSLVEMLVVLSVIALVTAATAPTFFSMMKANRLSAAGEDIVNRISLAQQMAVSRNQEVDLRFYAYEDPETPGSSALYRSMLVVAPTADPNAPPAVAGQAPAAKILSEISFIKNGIVVADTATLSPIFSEQSRVSNPDNEQIIKSGTANYKTLKFFPDGSCDVGSVQNQAYFTVVEERDIKGQDIPKNFFAIQIDRYTSRVITHRP